MAAAAAREGRGVARRFGLRTEIIVNLLLLMGAALLFSGLLLLKLAERQLLDERVARVREELTILAQFLDEAPPAAVDAAARQSRFLRGFTLLAPDALYLVDAKLQVAVSAFAAEELPPERADLARARLERQPVEGLSFRTTLLPWPQAVPGQVRVTVPLLTHGEFAGALQGHFPLAGVEERMRTARGLFLLYAGLYGGVLFGFGLWLLGNAVVRPVQALRSAARRVAAGDLETPHAASGPREIAELGDDFNAMTAALRAGREQTAEHIRALEQANAELRRTQADLVRSEKLASVGRLAAGMAHEIGNPLGALLGYLELLRAESAATPAGELAQRAVAEAERIDRLVRDLLDYAAPDGAAAERLDPAAVAAEAALLLRQQGALDGITLHDELPKQLPQVLVARHKLLQVLVNLLLNARDAAPGGNLRLAGGSEGGSVWLAVSDDGGGMDETTRQQVFDPFFTTKAPGRGRGLGLSVCHRIIEEAGGRIEVVSQPHAGSTFRICLPPAGEKS